MRDFSKEAAALLREHLGRLWRHPDLGPALALKPGLDPKEAEYFILGLEQGVFSIDDEGYAQSTVLPGSTHQKKILQLFWHGPTGRRFLFREGVCQLATVSALILEHGWPIGQIQMEPSFADLPHLAYSVDIVLRDAKGAVVGCCEVKRNDSELRLLLDGFRHCCERGAHMKANCSFKKNHAKFEFCVAIKPQFFMAASPRRQIALRLKYDADYIAVAPLHSHLIRNI